MKRKLQWDPQASVSFWINHASRLLIRHFEQRLRPLYFGMAYLPVLIALEENGALLQKDLARLAFVEQPTMAALLARMERDGLIVRAPHPDDKRASRISLSKKARAGLPQAKQRLQDVLDEATLGLSAAEQGGMIRLLQRVALNLDPPAAD